MALLFKDYILKIILLKVGLYTLDEKFRKAGEILPFCPSALFCYNLKEG
jgi:hypothetical protein